MSKTTIPAGGIADDAISEEHLDITAITGHTALAESPADTDEFLISDGGVLKRIDASHVGGSLAGIDDQTSSNDDQLTITDSAVVINEDSDDLDFRVESNGNTHMLFVN